MNKATNTSGHFNAASIDNVSAVGMTRGEYNTYRGWDIPVEENPHDEGYCVTSNRTGHINWMPKEQFDTTFLNLNKPVPFGVVLELVNRGARAYRLGWNGKGMRVMRVPGGNVCGTLEQGRFILVMADGKRSSSWVPSSSDLQATDWMVE